MQRKFNSYNYSLPNIQTKCRNMILFCGIISHFSMTYLCCGWLWLCVFVHGLSLSQMLYFLNAILCIIKYHIFLWMCHGELQLWQMHRLNDDCEYLWTYVTALMCDIFSQIMFLGLNQNKIPEFVKVNSRLMQISDPKSKLTALSFTWTLPIIRMLHL